MNLMKTLSAEFVLLKGVNADSVSIDLIHNTRHLCTRFRIAGIKATMSRGISRGKQNIKFANGGMREIPVDFVYSFKTKRRPNSHANCRV